MTYICPFCHHQQKERSHCKKCNFDLRSNHLNPYCSKCFVKFADMGALKIHFKFCGFESIKSQDEGDELHKCDNCNMENTVNTHTTIDCPFKKNSSKLCYLCGHSMPVESGLCVGCGYSTQESFQCPKCKVYYSTLYNLRKHFNQFCKGEQDRASKHCKRVLDEISSLNTVKKKKISEEVTFQCHKCKINFSQKYNRDKHLKRNVCSLERYAKCYFEGCDVRCLRRVGLLKHIQESHGVEMKYEFKKFPSFHNFELWKDQYGIETLTFYTIMSKTKYVSSNGDTINSITYGCSFDCQRSLKLKNQLSERLLCKDKKSRFDLSSTNVCPARITIKIFPNEEVVAKFCRTHSHDLSLDNIKVQILPKSRRDFLTQAFLIGATVEQVMEVIKKEAEQLKLETKESTLDRRFFKELQRKTFLKFTAKDDMFSINQSVDNLKLNDSVLIYKNGEKSFGEVEGLDNDAFVLGWQTPDMWKMLHTFGEVIYAEGLYEVINHPGFRLYNFLVSEETNTPLPVAHFITNKTDIDHLRLIFYSLKSRTVDISVETLVIQNNEVLEMALSGLFECETILLNDWDFPDVEQLKKPNENVEYSIFGKGEQDLISNAETGVVSDRTRPSDKCVFIFYRDLKYQLKRCSRIYFLLNLLCNYFKEKYSEKFHLEDENSIPRQLTEMRNKLLNFKCEDVLESDINRIGQLFCGDQTASSDEENNDVQEITNDSSETESEEEESSFESDAVDNDDDLTIDDSEGSTADKKDILTEILASDDVVDDDSSLHILEEYQKSIVKLLKENVLARPLIMKDVLKETKHLYEEVRLCCKETTNLMKKDG